MPDLDLVIRVDPIGTDRFAIVIYDRGSGNIRRTITGSSPDGLTEAELRGDGGLAVIQGMTAEKIDDAISLANAKRA
jgi:hypothetical protein